MTPAPDQEETVRAFNVVLVLSGGNALGAFEAGVYEALHEHGLQPDWIIGASIGAINGALIAGSAPDRRIETLRTFWRPAPSGAPPLPWLGALETSRRTNAVGWSATLGRPGSFGPMLSTLAPWADSQPSIYETDQLATTLETLVDFDRLNTSRCRYTATATNALHRGRPVAAPRPAPDDIGRGDEPHAGSDLSRAIPPHDRTVASRARRPPGFRAVAGDRRSWLQHRDAGLPATKRRRPLSGQAGPVR